MHNPTPFTTVASVEGWDAWFRWRDADGLHDRTIESTWWRVAHAAADAEGGLADTWARRFVDTFRVWRLLPDERLLSAAGTRMPVAADGGLHAALNAGAFVLSRGHLDTDRLADTAALAVRLLDDALLAACPPDAPHDRVRIGLLGVADALHLMGVDYADPQASIAAARLAGALADGALRGAVELAIERGGHVPTPAQLQAWGARGTEPALIADAVRHGVRFPRLTAIDPHPRLACLANLASDALDPRGGTVADDLPAQLRLRAAMQPWIDAPIRYPLHTVLPVPEARLEQLAREHGIEVPAVE